jgi:hypothetical protein
LELVGLGAVRDRLTVYPDVLTLSELLKPEKHKDWCVPAFGLNIQEEGELIEAVEEVRGQMGTTTQR